VAAGLIVSILESSEDRNSRYLWSRNNITHTFIDQTGGVSLGYGNRYSNCNRLAAQLFVYYKNNRTDC